MFPRHLIERWYVFSHIQADWCNFPVSLVPPRMKTWRNRWRWVWDRWFCEGSCRDIVTWRFRNMKNKNIDVCYRNIPFLVDDGCIHIQLPLPRLTWCQYVGGWFRWIRSSTEGPYSKVCLLSEKVPFNQNWQRDDVGTFSTSSTSLLFPECFIFFLLLQCLHLKSKSFFNHIFFKEMLSFFDHHSFQIQFFPYREPFSRWWPCQSTSSHGLCEKGTYWLLLKIGQTNTGLGWVWD